MVDVVVILFYLLLRMTDKRQKATKVKCKRDESISQYFSPVLLELVRKRSQNLTIIDQEKHKVKQVNIWNPVTTEFADVPPGETSLEAEKRLYSQASSVKKKNEKEAQQKENTGFYTGIKLI